MTVRLSPLFSVPNTTPMKKMTSVHCRNTSTECVMMCASSSSGVVMPATSVRSQTPSIRSVMKTAAVTSVAKKKTILFTKRGAKREHKIDQSQRWSKSGILAA